MVHDGTHIKCFSFFLLFLQKKSIAIYIYWFIFQYLTSRCCEAEGKNYEANAKRSQKRKRYTNDICNEWLCLPCSYAVPNVCFSDKLTDLVTVFAPAAAGRFNVLMTMIIKILMPNALLLLFVSKKTAFYWNVKVPKKTIAHAVGDLNTKIMTILLANRVLYAKSV